MTRSPLLAQIGCNVDRIVSLDFPSYGVIGPLFEGAVKLQGDAICMQAAERLAQAATPGSTVILITGLILPGHHPHGETDGPIGTAVLARTIALAWKARVLVVVEPELRDLMTVLLRIAELQVVSPEALRQEQGAHRPVAAVVGLSRDRDRAYSEAEVWLGDFNASAVVAIEKAGANVHGVYHMVNGADITAQCGKGEALFAAAAKGGLLRIGIGDRGNELGMGPLAEVTRALLPFGTECRCPCHGGVADQTDADLAVPAVVSNWGAYGIATCIAATEERQDLLHTADRERRLLEAAVAHGGVDGMSGRALLSVDGIDVVSGMAFVEMLSEIYRAQSVRDPSPFSTPLIKD